MLLPFPHASIKEYKKDSMFVQLFGHATKFLPTRDEYVEEKQVVCEVT